MDIKKTRKAQLRRWVTENGTPGTEKSFFSQLMSPETSFGEKAARRLEADYQMGAMFLDIPDAPVAIRKVVKPKSGDQARFSTRAIHDALMVNVSELTELITLYAQSTEAGKSFILDAASTAEKITQ